METLLALIAANAVTGTVLAVLTAAVGRRWRNPGVLHVLWLLVLAKMLVPPALELRMLPDRVVTDPPPAAVPAAGLPSFRPEAVSASPAAAPSPTLPPLRALVVPVIALGALGVLGTAGVRAARFRLLLRGARPAPEPLAARVASLGAAMGLRRVPRLRVVDARIPPVLWPGPPCEILLPAALAESLTGEELDAMLAHELGHVRRRDHWTRAVELLAVAAFWWHPVVWWARRNLRAAEEACCDALVVRTLGGRSRPYADALLKTLEFLTRAPHRPVPALATGAGDFHRLKERLTMIVSRSTSRPLSPWKYRAVLGLALAALAVGPSWTAAEVRGETPAPPAPVPGTETPEPPEGVAAPPAVTAPPSVPAAKAPAAPAPSPDTAALGNAEMMAALKKLQAESAGLEKEMLELERQRELLQLRMEELESKRQALDMQEEAERLEKEGRPEHAELMRQQAELLRHQVALHAEELERDHARNVNRLEIESRLRALEMERAAAELASQLRELAPEAD